MGKFLMVLAVLMLASPAFAIDSLLEQAAKAEEKRVKKAKSADTTATFEMSSGEIVRCKWLARAGDQLRYLREDGKLFSTPAKDVVKIEGKVLAQTPSVDVVTHVMYCNGEYGKPCVKTISIPAWPQ
jgi:hypothetical protein